MRQPRDPGQGKGMVSKWLKDSSGNPAASGSPGTQGREWGKGGGWLKAGGGITEGQRPNSAMAEITTEGGAQVGWEASKVARGRRG